MIMDVIDPYIYVIATSAVWLVILAICNLKKADTE